MQIVKKQTMIVSTLGDSKPQSDTKKFLEFRVRVLNQTSNFDSTKNKVPKLSLIQKSSGYELKICCSTGDVKGDHLGTHKHKVRMISSQTAFTPTSDLRECLCQTHQTQQTSSTTKNSPAKLLTFNLLSFTPLVLHSVVSILKRSQYHSKKL